MDKTGLARAANRLYDAAPATHRVLYRAYKRWSDRGERAALRALLRPGMTVIDVGANIGIYTEFLAACVGPQGRVIAIEPAPDNVHRLETAARRLPQVTVVHAGVAARSGSITLYIADDLNVDHRTYSAEPGRRSIEVRALALDEYIAANERIDLIKMDIQGAELEAIEGARRVLTSLHPPHILFEYWPHGLRAAGREPRALPDSLRELGYVLTTVGEVPWPADAEDNPSVYVNVLARPSSR
jgi:FkbM family methyltransferase